MEMNQKRLWKEQLWFRSKLRETDRDCDIIQEAEI